MSRVAKNPIPLPSGVAAEIKSKLPVADLNRSRDWYTSVLGLRVDIEFVEDGVLRGLALADAGGRLRI